MTTKTLLPVNQRTWRNLGIAICSTHRGPITVAKKDVTNQGHITEKFMNKVQS